MRLPYRVGDCVFTFLTSEPADRFLRDFLKMLFSRRQLRRHILKHIAGKVIIAWRVRRYTRLQGGERQVHCILK